MKLGSVFSVIKMWQIADGAHEKVQKPSGSQRHIEPVQSAPNCVRCGKGFSRGCDCSSCWNSLIQTLSKSGHVFGEDCCYFDHTQDFYVTKKLGSPLAFLLGSLLCHLQVFHLPAPKGAQCKVLGSRLSFLDIYRYLVNSSCSWTERHLGLRLDYILNQVDSKIS